MRQNIIPGSSQLLTLNVVDANGAAVQLNDAGTSVVVELQSRYQPIATYTTETPLPPSYDGGVTINAAPYNSLTIELTPQQTAVWVSGMIHARVIVTKPDLDMTSDERVDIYNVFIGTITRNNQVTS